MVVFTFSTTVINIYAFLLYQCLRDQSSKKGNLCIVCYLCQHISNGSLLAIFLPVYERVISANRKSYYKIVLECAPCLFIKQWMLNWSIAFMARPLLKMVVSFSCFSFYFVVSLRHILAICFFTGCSL